MTKCYDNSGKLVAEEGFEPPTLPGNIGRSCIELATTTTLQLIGLRRGRIPCASAMYPLILLKNTMIMIPENAVPKRQQEGTMTRLFLKLLVALVVIWLLLATRLGLIP